MLRAATLMTVSLAGAFGLWTVEAQACKASVHLRYNEPVTLAGVLKSRTGRHEVHGAFTVIYLALDQPICVEPGKGDNEPGTEQPVDRVQLAGEAIIGELPTGKHAEAKGTLFPEHTMWHVEPVLLDASSIVLK